MDSQGSKLRKTLNLMFPSAYIIRHHKPPNVTCSPLALRPTNFVDLQQASEPREQLSPAEVSDEPSSRTSAIQLRQYLDSSLVAHQAKPYGLCPIRRNLYDQCFDELIRQVTVGCIEQGLMLFRIKNELMMTLDCYKRVYESGVTYGLNKAIRADQKSQLLQASLEEANTSHNQLKANNQLDGQLKDLEVRNKLDKLDKSVVYYEKQLAIKDMVIERQRATILAISADVVNRMIVDEVIRADQLIVDTNKI